MKQSVGELFRLYLQRSDLRPASVRFKSRAVGYFLEWFGDLPVTQVTPAMAEDYRTLLAKGRSKRTANGYLANFQPFWKWCFRHRRITINPFDNIRPYRITATQRETFSAAELSRLIRISTRLWRVRICFGLLGCRRGETLNITVRDINMSVPEPHILLSPKKQSEHTWPWDLKDHAVRLVALPERMRFDGLSVELHADIVKLMEDLPNEQPYLCIEPRYYQKLMVRQRDGILTDKHVSDPTGNFQRSFRRLQEKACIEPTRRYHELRAAFITKMIDQCGLSRAADSAGHSSVQTTRGYDRKSALSLVADACRITSQCYET